MVAVCVTLPPVAVTVTLLLPLGVEPVDPPAPQPLIAARPPASNSSVISVVARRDAVRVFLRSMKGSTSRPQASAPSPMPLNGKRSAADDVLMVTVSTLLPVAESVAGANVQRLLAGSPEQLKLTVELKPLTIATLTVVLDAGRFAGMTICALESENVKSGTGGAATTTVPAAEVDAG